MAETMTCPLCGKEHPIGTTWCVEQWAEIPTSPAEPASAVARCPFGDHLHDPAATYCEELSAVLPDGWALPRHPAEPAAIPQTEVEAEVSCPNCGDHGLAGSECRQCGGLIPNVAPIPARAAAGGRSAFVVLPSGRRVALPANRDIAIGRESELDEVRADLEPFDAVSRTHCVVRFDPVSNTLTVADPGSLNHTWVGSDPRALQPGERRSVSLPVRLRLGQHLAVSIAGDGPR